MAKIINIVWILKVMLVIKIELEKHKTKAPDLIPCRIFIIEIKIYRNVLI